MFSTLYVYPNLKLAQNKKNILSNSRSDVYFTSVLTTGGKQLSKLFDCSEFFGSQSWQRWKLSTDLQIRSTRDRTWSITNAVRFTVHQPSKDLFYMTCVALNLHHTLKQYRFEQKTNLRKSVFRNLNKVVQYHIFSEQYAERSWAYSSYYL